MSLILKRKCAHSFQATIRSRGEDYFLENRVSFSRFQKAYICANVYGSKNYQVDMYLEKPNKRYEIVSTCTCPFFLDGELCKHIWATICAAAARGWAEDAASESREIDVTAEDERFFDADLSDESTITLTEDTSWSNIPSTRNSRGLPHGACEAPWRNLVRYAKEISHGTNLEKTQNQPPSPLKKGEIIWYMIDPLASETSGLLTIEILHQEMTAKGTLGKPKPCHVFKNQISQKEDAADQNALRLLFGCNARPYDHASSMGIANKFHVSPPVYDLALPVLLETKRLRLSPIDSNVEGTLPLNYTKDKWRLNFSLDRDADKSSVTWHLNGNFTNGVKHAPLHEMRLLLPDGLLILQNEIAELETLKEAQLYWLKALRQAGPVSIADNEISSFLEATTNLPYPLPFEWPEDLGWQHKLGSLVPCLSIQKDISFAGSDFYNGTVTFAYSGHVFSQVDAQHTWVDKDQKIIWKRASPSENKALEKLGASPYVIRNSTFLLPYDVTIRGQGLATLATELIQSGWRVMAEGRSVKSVLDFEIAISSGIDWFDLNANVDYGSEKVPLPTLLKALMRGDKYIALGDGSVGMLPLEWLKKFGTAAELGEEHEGKIRYNRAQSTLLDAFLDEMPQIAMDEAYLTWRKKLRSFAGISPVKPTPEFQGTLRTYQHEGLGWLTFLRDFGFGGCLADDMGLGKTVQILALLAAHHVPAVRTRKAPSLIVVPRSLIHNWIQEAKRFAPTLKVLDYSGTDRQGCRSHFHEYDLILTTYTLLRLDLAWLKDFTFEYAILDEAQAIKNRTSQSAKSARLVRAKHRLALSGTPVENHMSDILSIFEFLNPGLLKDSFVAGVSKRDSADSERIALLARGLRPFILRRTKEQVLKELPPKTEQTILCDLEGKERKQYDDLKKHYKRELTATIENRGFARAKIQILEALLRLRQAACHPGLLDPNRIGERSAKLDSLLEHLTEIVESGHKALIFSQFTSMLTILRWHLDKRKIPYVYLDGTTRNREAKVHSFQSDPKIPLFLISLKAGGVGLNLTAADYCFILDPWWNPAAEAQAIDRAHRMGQTKHVFAYRLIAKGTVEEKILSLQEKKRALSKAIISAENSALKDLSLEDLDLLLS